MKYGIIARTAQVDGETLESNQDGQLSIKETFANTRYISPLDFTFIGGSFNGDRIRTDPTIGDFFQTRNQPYTITSLIYVSESGSYTLHARLIGSSSINYYINDILIGNGNTSDYKTFSITLNAGFNELKISSSASSYDSIGGHYITT